MKRYFEVAVPLPLRKNFTYYLPETLEQNLQTGMRVLVPFGSREVIGYILGEQKEEDIQIRGEKIKGIMKILDEESLFDEEILNMTRWASDYYICGLGEMIGAALPSGAGRVADRKAIKITEAGLKVLDKKGGTDKEKRMLLQFLRPKEEMSLAQLRRQSGLPNFGEVLKSLLEKKWAEARISRSILQPKEKVEVCARIEKKEKWTLDDYKERCKSAVRQIAVLELLFDEEKILPYSEIKEKTGVALSVLRSLKKKGLVYLEKRKIRRKPIVLDKIPRKDIILNKEQQAALEEIEKILDKKKFNVFLLKGVTGSGKTEVYLRAMESVLKKGRDALYLVPEISLTPMLQREISGRFGDKVSLLHSALSPGERFDEWLRAKHGEADIVLGARSAVFAPLGNLGLIIIDEEQDPSYKQEDSPRYNARDLALIRARERNIPVVMGSATPSIESYTNARSGKFTLLELTSRVEKRPLPEVRVVDMKEEFKKEGESVVLSEQLKLEIDRKFQAGEQVLILLNRRGFSAFVQCRDCGEVIQCPRCSLALTYHKISERLMCHYCGYWKRKSKKCPSCASEHLFLGGEGTEKLEEMIHGKIQGLRIGRFDRDSVKGRGGHIRILKDFESGKIDLLLGTQMIAKGHDFPLVTLVGVVSADRALSFPDFRASERTFQLITQVSGRAGRGDNPGQVIIQAYHSGHYAIQTAIRQNFEEFYEKELRFRKIMKYPPFSVIANIIVQNTDRERASSEARKVAQLMKRFSGKKIAVMGPSLAPLARIRKNYRYQVVLRAQSRKDIKELFFKFFEHVEKKKIPIRRFLIDVDPVSLM